MRRTLLASTTSMIVTSLPASGPKLIRATRPTSTNLVKVYNEQQMGQVIKYRAYCQHPNNNNVTTKSNRVLWNSPYFYWDV